MPPKKIIPLLLICLLTVSCDRNTRNATVTVDTVETDFFESLDSGPLSITYEGDLPCADCEAIHTSLLLTPDSLSFTLTETYKGKGGEDSVFHTKGNYSKIMSGDSVFTILELKPDNHDHKLFFREAGDTAVTKLDQLGNIIPGTLNYTLRRI